uniref:Uncharacterized protein n=1 Tax=Chaetoceros debilis TaxID=122233 RepID=A0A7S3Q8C7_9STRA
MVDTPFKIRVIVDGEAVRIPEGADAQSEVPVGNEGREGEKQIQIEKNDDVAMKEKKNQDLESDENIEKNEGESQTETRIDSPFKLQLTVIVNGVTQSLDANDEIEEVQVGKKINGKKDNITTENNESQEKDNDVGVGVPSGVRRKPKKAKSASAAKTAVPASKKKKAIKKRKGRGKSLPSQNIETNDTQETATAVEVRSRPRSESNDVIASSATPKRNHCKSDHYHQKSIKEKREQLLSLLQDRYDIDKGNTASATLSAKIISKIDNLVEKMMQSILRESDDNTGNASSKRQKTGNQNGDDSNIATILERQESITKKRVKLVSLLKERNDFSKNHGRNDELTAKISLSIDSLDEERMNLILGGDGDDEETLEI